MKTLIARATEISEGKRYIVAEVIGVSEAGLSRSLRAGRLSTELRGRLVELVRAGTLPDHLPPARAPGRRPRAASEAQSVMLYFDSEETEREFLRLGRAHASGRIGVLVDAARAYRTRHTKPPTAGPAPPARKARCRLPHTELEMRRDLAAFDAWIGGAEARPRVISIVLAEHCKSSSTIELGGTVLELAQGTVEVYPIRRRSSPTGASNRRGHNAHLS